MDKKEPSKILEDDRPIASIHFDDEHGSSIHVRNPSSHVSRIVAYGERSAFSVGLVPWLALFDSQEQIVQRIPAHHVRIAYFKCEEE